MLELAPYAVLCFAPALFWLWYFRHRDDLEPEPRALVLRVFVLGCASTALVLFLRPSLSPLLPAAGLDRHLADAFLLTAPLEEAAKALALVLGIYFHRELDEPLDGIVYGTAAGLGFASVENVFYFVQHDQARVILLRAFTATPAHFVTTGALGFCLALAKLGPPARRAPLWLLGALIAVALHGGYDLFLFAGDGLHWLSLLGVLPLGLVLLGLKIRWARARSAAS